MELTGIYNMDCMKGMKEIPDGSIDMILCDLPYGTTECEWDTIIPLEPLWEQYERIIKDNGAIVLTASQPFTSMLVTSNIKAFKHSWIWQKNAGSNFGSVKYQPFKEHEDVLVFSKGGKKVNYFPIMQERSESGKNRIKTKVNYKTKTEVYAKSLHGEVSSKRPYLRYPSSVQKFNRERGFHPTQKPVALFEYLIKTYTKKGEIVLDNCMGSGTTAIACLNTDRQYIGFELDEDYYRMATERIEKHKSQMNLFLDFYRGSL